MVNLLLPPQVFKGKAADYVLVGRLDRVLYAKKYHKSNLDLAKTNLVAMNKLIYQVVKAQWLAWRFATGEILGLNPGKGENL